MSDMSTQKNGVTAGRIIVGLLVALLVVFAVLNSQRVQMHWIIGTNRPPLFVLLLVFSLIGMAIGFFAGRRNTRRG